MRKKEYEKPSFLKSGRRILVMTLALSLAMSGTAFASLNHVLDVKTKNAVMMGDVDQNGSIELADANLTLKAALSITELTGDAKTAADVDFNGLIELADANLILKAALGIEVLPTAQPSSETPVTTPPVTTPPVTTPPVTTPPVTTPPVTTPPVTTPPVTTPPVTTHTYPTGQPIPTVLPGPVVTGEAVQVSELNGATVDNSIITFTADNATAKSGVKMVNPFAGRTDLRQTVDQALAGQPPLTDLKGHTGEDTYDPTLTYPRPVWNNGVSVSFWVRSDWVNPELTNSAPFLLFKDDAVGTGFAFMVRLNAGVRFEAADTSGNEFRANNYLAGKNKTWNYYTVTIANDWITVYVNGQEVVYWQPILMKKVIEHFNDGFLSRYNTVGTVTQADVDADIRGYIKAAGGWYLDSSTGKYRSNTEFTIIGNGRYANPDAVRNRNLLVDLITNSSTEMYLGGTNTYKLSSGSTGYATYSVPEGTKLTGVTSYTKELKADEVAANYEASYTEYKDTLGLE